MGILDIHSNTSFTWRVFNKFSEQIDEMKVQVDPNFGEIHKLPKS